MAVIPLCTGVVLHIYVYGLVPPLAVTVALPLLCPQPGDVLLIIAIGPPGLLKITLHVAVHIPPSVTVTVYVPAGILVTVALVCAGVVLHTYVYGTPLPPLADTVALPLLCPHPGVLNIVQFTIGATISIVTGQHNSIGQLLPSVAFHI